MGAGGAMMADEERQHAERLLYEYRRRLRYREGQKARLGDMADPSIERDIEELRQNIAMLEPVVEPAPSAEVVEVVKRHIADDYLFVYRQLVKFGERVTGMEGRVAVLETKVDDEQGASAVWREGHQKAHDASERDRQWGQQRNLWLLVAILALLAIVVARYVGG